MAVLHRVAFRVGQGLDGRPQLIDPRLAVTGLLALFDTGRAFDNASSRLPLSGVGNSSLDATITSPSVTNVGASRHSVIPSIANDVGSPAAVATRRNHPWAHLHSRSLRRPAALAEEAGHHPVHLLPFPPLRARRGLGGTGDAERAFQQRCNRRSSGP